MEFKDLFGAVALTFVVVIAFFGLSNEVNTSWGSTIGDDIESNLTEQNTLILSTLGSTAQNTRNTGTVEEGASTETAEGNILSRGYSILTNIFGFINLPNKMIGVFLDLIPELDARIKLLAQYVFAFAYYVTLAYLLITGGRRLFS